MNAIHACCTTIMDWLMAPFAAQPLLGLFVCSITTGVLMSVVFRYTSNQKALSRVVDRTQGNLLAIKLFKDDLPGMFTSLGNILRYVVLRLWYSLIPMLVMLPPLVLLLSQLALRYEHRPLAVGESAVIELQLKEEAWVPFQSLQIMAPPVIEVETPALRDARERSICWSVRATEPTTAMLSWRVGTTSAEKQLVAANEARLRAISPRRPGSNWWDRVLHPGEPGITKSSPISGINLAYPHRDTPILGKNVPWWLTFFLVSILAALSMQPLVKVRF